MTILSPFFFAQFFFVCVAFFIALDHENGPLTLHSSVYEVFRYVQAGLRKLKDQLTLE